MLMHQKMGICHIQKTLLLLLLTIRELKMFCINIFRMTEKYWFLNWDHSQTSQNDSSWKLVFCAYFKYNKTLKLWSINRFLQKPILNAWQFDQTWDAWSLTFGIYFCVKFTLKVFDPGGKEDYKMELNATAQLNVHIENW